MAINLSWETRIAAAHTVESIMKNLNEAELMSEFFSETESTAGASSSSSFDESSVFSVTLENFNLTELLRKHPILVSSDTQKYDSKDQDTNSSCSSTSSGGGGGGGNSMAISGQMSEKLKQQRHLLNLKLGIDVGGAAKLDTTEIFSDYDIMSSHDSELASGGGGGSGDTFDPNRAKRRLPDVPGVVIFFYFGFRNKHKI